MYDSILYLLFGIFSVLGMVKNAAVNFLHVSLVGHEHSFLLDKYSAVEFLGYKVRNIVGKTNLQKWL
jgi:hypothetical protein